MKVFKFIHLILFFGLAYSIPICHAQVFDNYILLSPYQNNKPAIGRTMGGATVALLDSIPAVFNNPASISQNRSITSFISLHSSAGKINIKDSPSVGLKPHRWNNIVTTGSFSVSLPFHLLHHPFGFAGSYNGSVPLDYEIGEGYFSINPEYSGQLQTATLGLGGQLSSKFRYGFGWTHWFGKRKWRITGYPGEDYINQRISHYSGDHFLAGIQKNISHRIDLGVVLYFPFQLFISQNDIFQVDSRYRSEDKSELSQRYASALQVGVAYTLNSSAKFGLSYGYQRRFSATAKSGTNYAKVSYSHLSSITGGFEYIIHLKKLSLPVFLMYEATWLPEITGESNNFIPSFMSTFAPQFDKNPISHSIDLGSTIPLRYFSMYLTAQWKHTGKYVKYPSPET